MMHMYIELLVAKSRSNVLIGPRRASVRVETPHCRRMSQSTSSVTTQPAPAACSSAYTPPYILLEHFATAPTSDILLVGNVSFGEYSVEQTALLSYLNSSTAPLLVGGTFAVVPKTYVAEGKKWNGDFPDKGCLLRTHPSEAKFIRLGDALLAPRQFPYGKCKASCCAFTASDAAAVVRTDGYAVIASEAKRDLGYFRIKNQRVTDYHVMLRVPRGALKQSLLNDFCMRLRGACMVPFSLHCASSYGDKKKLAFDIAEVSSSTTASTIVYENGQLVGPGVKLPALSALIDTFYIPRFESSAARVPLDSDLAGRGKQWMLGPLPDAPFVNIVIPPYSLSRQWSTDKRGCVLYHVFENADTFRRRITLVGMQTGGVLGDLQLATLFREGDAWADHGVALSGWLVPRQSNAKDDRDARGAPNTLFLHDVVQFRVSGTSFVVSSSKAPTDHWECVQNALPASMFPCVVASASPPVPMMTGIPMLPMPAWTRTSRTVLTAETIESFVTNVIQHIGGRSSKSWKDLYIRVSSSDAKDGETSHLELDTQRVACWPAVNILPLFPFGSPVHVKHIDATGFTIFSCGLVALEGTTSPVVPVPWMLLKRACVTGYTEPGSPLRVHLTSGEPLSSSFAGFIQGNRATCEQAFADLSADSKSALTKSFAELASSATTADARSRLLLTTKLLQAEVAQTVDDVIKTPATSSGKKCEERAHALLKKIQGVLSVQRVLTEADAGLYLLAAATRHPKELVLQLSAPIEANRRVGGSGCGHVTLEGGLQVPLIDFEICKNSCSLPIEASSIQRYRPAPLRLCVEDVARYLMCKLSWFGIFCERLAPVSATQPMQDIAAERPTTSTSATTATSPPPQPSSSASAMAVTLPSSSSSSSSAAATSFSVSDLTKSVEELFKFTTANSTH